ncbi:MAG: toxin-antitoxin system HicB family antitoxin [Pyrinomonadaceae bacterium]|nr:toxin-antitoxin system HicB family antitoxin [Pyrinomonadaceae bacterium]
MSVISVDLPDSISQKLIELTKNKIEIEQFIVVAVAEKLKYLQARAKRANLDDFEKILAKIPDVEADEFDKIR